MKNQSLLGSVLVLFTLALPVGKATEPDLEEKYAYAQAQYQRLLAEYEVTKNKLAEEKSRSLIPSVVQGRLTLTTGEPVYQTDVTAAGTLYFTPYKGNQISLYFRGGWKLISFTEKSIAIAGASGKNYDVFAYRAAGGVVTLELGTAWTSDTARAVALSSQDGILVLSTDITRRYLGTIRLSAPNKADDAVASRFVWNYYNRVPRKIGTLDGTNTYQYNKAIWRNTGNNAGNTVAFVIGVNEVLVRARMKSNVISSAAAARNYSFGIGLDDAAANSAQLFGGMGPGSGTVELQPWAEYAGYPGIGYRLISTIEYCGAGANVTAWGDNNAPTPVGSGMVTYVEG